MLSGDKKNLRPIRSHLRIRASHGEADPRCRTLHPSHSASIDMSRDKHRRFGLSAGLVDADGGGLNADLFP